MRWDKSNILLAVCLVFIGGVFIVSVFQFPKSVWDFLFFRHRENHISNFNDVDKTIIIWGQIAKEPSKRNRNTQLVIKVREIEIGKKQKKVSGKILVTLKKYPEYYYGDELRMIGKLKTPAEFEGFNYKGYLAKDRIYSVMYYPDIETTGKNYGNLFYKTIFSFKNKTKQAVEKIMPLPEVSILEALVLGNKQGLTDNLKNQLNNTGTRHITAISGMHILIISQALMALLISLGLWRGQAFYLTLFLLVLFILMIGAPASAVRAGIMGGILLFAEKMGRLNNSGRAVVFAGTIMLILNPLLLRFDVGFQLSFLAALGIIYIKPILNKWIDGLLSKTTIIKNWLFKGKIKEQIPDITAMTFSAQIATLPILIYNFGQVSLISPLVNILIVPILPYIMGIGFIFSFAAVLWSFLGRILIWPAWFAFAYITKTIDVFSRTPFVVKGVSNIDWCWLLIYYVFLAGFLFWFYKIKKVDVFDIDF